MSHFTRIRTKLAEKQYIMSALEDMGYKPEEGGQVRGYARQQTSAEIRVSTSSGYDIGFHKSGDNYDIVADWYGIRNVQQPQFVEQLTQRYAYHATRAKLEEQGFALVSEESEKDGRIHLVVRRMV